jgi:predicted DNA-binding transcriptional regulator AlpA
MQRKYFRIRELASVPGRDGLLPVAPATVWRWVKRGEFPAPVRLSGGVTAWAAEAIEAWMQKAATAEPAANTGKAGAASVEARRAKRSSGAAQ